MSMNAGGYDKVLNVANGYGRRDIEAQANLAFDEANERRAALSGGLGLSFLTRAEVVLRAEAWADVLRYLDRAGAATFSLQDFRPKNAGRPAFSRYGLVRGLALTYGSKPFTFYEQPRRKAAGRQNAMPKGR